MPYALVLDAEVTDTSLPVLYPDPGMSPGTLFLFDAAHSQSGLTAGVVPTSGTFTNIARDTAAAALGKSASLLDWTVGYTRSAGDDSFKVERTTKGGIHGVSSHVGQTTGGTDEDAWYIDPMSDLKQGILDLVPGSAVFSSMWFTTTRLGIAADNTAPQSMTHMTAVASATANRLFYSAFDSMGVQGFIRGPGANGPANTPGLAYVGSSAWIGTRPTDISTFMCVPALLGRARSWKVFNRNKAPSLILYRSKVEDLSKTKRANNGAGGTFAEEAAAALAVEQALHNAAFGAGGKFHGDAWSNPAVYLP